MNTYYNSKLQGFFENIKRQNDSITTRNNIIKPFILTNIIQKFTDIENEKKRKIRELRDISTKCFVNIFFDSIDILLKFVYWVFHKINCRLLEIQKKFCISSEKIIFFFKGGNIMFIWRNKIEEIYGNVDKDIGAKTAISDSDFAIYILTKDEQRFNEIYSQITSVLITELEEIGAMFDELFNKTIKKNKNNNNYNLKNQNLDFDCENFIKNEKKIFNNFFKDFYTKDKITKFLADVKSELEKLIGIDFYEEKNNEIFRYNIPDNDFSVQVDTRQSLILRPEDKVPISFSLKNFSNSKNHYVTVNANIFNNLSKAGHLVSFDLYRIKFYIIIDKIIKSKYNQISNNFNSKILQKIFRIPSEFIDISVSKYYDLNLQKLREDFYNDKKLYLSNKFALIGYRLRDGTRIPQSILTMQMKYIIDDLLITLFYQNYYNPLIDSKYQKRLFRIFFFYIGNNLLKKRKIIPSNIFDKIDSDNFFYKYFLNDDDNLDINYIKNMKGKLLYNFFNIKNQYNDLRYLLQFTILFNKLINHDDILSEFIVYYNNIYNILDNSNIQDFKIKFAKFKKDLTDNYKIAYHYFNSFININSKQKLAGGMKNTKENTKEINNRNNNNRSIANTENIGIFEKSVNNLFENLDLNETQVINKLLFNIGDGVTLEYKDIDLLIGYQERIFYSSFKFDDDI